MKLVTLFFFLVLTGWIFAGEVQWGGSSSFKEQENKEFTAKDLNFKDITNEFMGEGHSGVFDKEFPTSNYAPFDKDFDLGTKEYQTITLNFYKEFPTKDLDFNSKTSILDKENSTFKLTDAPWASRQVAPGFDKQLPSKEYQGPEAQIIRRDITDIYKGLNAVRNVPDHDLTIDEVRDLLNKDHGPSLKFTEPAKPGQDPSAQPTSKVPLQ